MGILDLVLVAVCFFVFGWLARDGQAHRKQERRDANVIDLTAAKRKALETSGRRPW